MIPSLRSASTNSLPTGFVDAVRLTGAARHLRSQGCCPYCEQDDPEKLQFHHRDPRQKKFDITNPPNDCAFVTFQRELKKCDLVCVDCHAEIHRQWHEAGFWPSGDDKDEWKSLRNAWKPLWAGLPPPAVTLVKRFEPAPLEIHVLPERRDGHQPLMTCREFHLPL